MALDTDTQFFSALEGSKYPLVVLPENPSGDSICAGRALSLVLERLGKEVSLVYSQTFDSAFNFDFLSCPKEIRHNLLGVRDFVFIFNTTRNPIGNVRTEQSDGEFRIYLTPQKGSIDPRDFSFIPTDIKYDRIFLLGVRDKESLGNLYEENADVFFEVPLINIDVRSDNEQYAQTNIVEVTSSSVSELITNLLSRAKKNYISEEIAQCLLAGIICGTESFQSSVTTPKSLQFASFLIDKGADQHEIVRNLYKKQSFSLLKLLGKVLAKLQWEESLSMIWAMIEMKDFSESKASFKDLPAIMERIRSYTSSASCILLLYANEEGFFSGILRAKDKNMYMKLNLIIPGATLGDYYVFHCKEKYTEEVQKNLLEKIKTL
ncbi:MAG: hypothetical protein IPN70_02790 [Candidatus Moraniibacteriota bacterium]|nr:MAG: hypothetical protein IPN70_02790 [Candidatus Moranbacteria bacterium]